MPEQSQANEGTRDPKRARKRIWAVAAIALAAFVIAALLWKAGLWNFQTVDEQLAAIEAARAIPDDENAATIYSQLLENYDESFFSPGFLDNETDDSTRDQPWSSEDYPELANWLKAHQNTLSALLEACKKQSCRFTISPYSQQGFKMRVDRLGAMRQWAVLLVRAGNNDMAEGRIDAALEKYRCLIQMANHLCQQPVMIDHLVGFAIEALALHGAADFIVQGDATDEYLRTVEAFPLQTKNNWSRDSQIFLEVERLYIKKETNFLNRLRFFWFQDEDDRIENRFHEIYLRVLAARRGNRILAALRRYRNNTGRWPESLAEIRSSLSQEILIDPQNNGSFAYKLTDDGFKLYSKGKNNVDEDGKYRDPADDWPIWPPKARKSKKTDPNTG